MPMYEYQCGDCRKKFTKVLTIAEHGKEKESCPGCGSTKVEQILSPFFAKTSHKA